MNLLYLSTISFVVLLGLTIDEWSDNKKKKKKEYLAI